MKRAAAEREEAKTLPTRDKFLFDPVWTATREEREKEVRELLDGALSVVTDAPILKLQEDIHKQQDKIAADRDRIAMLREKRVGVPQPGLLPSFFTETTDRSTSRLLRSRRTSSSAKPASFASNRRSAKLLMQPE